MKPGAGKRKGGAFEREACKKLSLWISDGIRDDIFWRSAMSGGRASVKFKKGEQNITQIGDISAIDPAGAAFIKEFVVECKFYQNLYLENLIFNTSNNGILGFWKILNKIAINSKKIPFLVAKQNHKKPILVTSHQVLNILTVNNYKNFTRGEFPNFVVYDFDEFLKKIDPVIFTDFPKSNYGCI